MIVFTKDRQGEIDEFFASNRGDFEDGKLAILINRGSASASEIVAGAIQDHKRGSIVGRRSFGKGLVQEEITLKDGSKMRLTTQRYYTPSGRSIQRDYDTYDESFYFHGNTGSESSTDSTILLPEETEFQGSRNQGGIIPDIEVGYDTSASTRLLYHLAMTVNLDEQAFEYVDLRRKELATWEEDSFVKYWQADAEVLESFFGKPVSERVSQEDSLQQVVLKNRLKAFIAYNKFGTRAYQRVYAQDDPYVLQAISALKPD